MSSISAGLSNATALVSTGDTTGQLVLKTNGGTTAVTIGTDQSVTFAAGVVTTSPTVLPAGTASAPALTTTGDTNTGLFFPAADTIAFSEGGTEAMRIDSSGRVGIGTTSPGSTLNLEAATCTIRLKDTGASDYALIGTDDDGSLSLYARTAAGIVDFRTNNTERARITSGGYFKASDDGTYENSTGAYHEFKQTANQPLVFFKATNASFGNSGHYIRMVRSATAGYYFAEYNSSNGDDNEFLFRGDGNGYADGTWNNNGADYAEFFESANGQALTLGATVVLDGNKVREATEQDPASAVIGVVRPKEPSKASMVIGNTAWNKWANKYLTDDFDRYIMEDHDVIEWTDEEGKSHSYESQAIPEGITVPQDATRKTHDNKGNKFQHYKLNPAWNPDSEYVNRENRPEWNIIGLLGQVKILKGQPVGDRWIKMRDVSETVEEWFIR